MDITLHWILIPGMSCCGDEKSSGGSAFRMADEAAFIELVIASERVGKWMDIIQQPSSRTRLINAVKELEAAVVSSEAYAEEAVASGVIPELLKLLKEGVNPEIDLSNVSSIIGICSGDNATSGKVSHFEYGDVSVVVTEGALGQGLGAKMWEVAHIMNRYLHDHKDLVAGKRVLEIGSGCGSTGILAAKLGAERVYLTDYVPSVLLNLRSCVKLNRQMPMSIEIEDAGDLSDASTVSDLDLGELNLEDADQNGNGEWDAGNMHVRYLDWSESVINASNTTPSPSECMTDLEHDLPESLNLNASFEVLLGTDVLYEAEHAILVASVISHRLAHQGKCLLACAIREQAYFNHFYDLCMEKGLRVQCEHVPTPDAPRYNEYEGGFVMIALDWESHPGWVGNEWKPESTELQNDKVDDV